MYDTIDINRKRLKRRLSTDIGCSECFFYNNRDFPAGCSPVIPEAVKRCNPFVDHLIWDIIKINVNPNSRTL